MTKEQVCAMMNDKKTATEYYRQTILAHKIAKVALDGFHNLQIEYPHGVHREYLIEILTQDGYMVEELPYGLRIAWGDNDDFYKTFQN